MTAAAHRLGIVELADVCARMRAVGLDLFEELGSWVALTPAGPLQRRYAEACHRHAWHAELWSERSPAIPGNDPDAAVAAARAERLPRDPDADAYRRVLEELLAELADLVGRIDPGLDPSTARVVDVVRRDLVDLLAS